MGDQELEAVRQIAVHLGIEPVATENDEYWAQVASGSRIATLEELEALASEAGIAEERV